MKLILLYILLIQTSYGTSTFYKDDNFSLSIISKSDKNIINFEGLIRKPLVQEFKKLIRDSNTLLPIELRLNSEGGSIYETQQLISFINTLKEKNFTINTRVNLGSMCASSCVPIFVQGEVREAGSASSFMFHGVSVALITNIPEAESTQIMIDTYRDAGISER